MPMETENNNLDEMNLQNELGKFDTVDLMTDKEIYFYKKIRNLPNFMNFLIWLGKKYYQYKIHELTSTDAERELNLQSWEADRYFRELIRVGCLETKSRGILFIRLTDFSEGKILFEKLVKFALNMKKRNSQLEIQEVEKNA